jgi:hypothetical protein
LKNWRVDVGIEREEGLASRYPIKCECNDCETEAERATYPGCPLFGLI